MARANSPFEITPPSGRRLLWSCTAALLAAVALLIVAVLPAEYGIDPTGLGSRFGLFDLSNANSGATAPALAASMAMSTTGATAASAREPAPLPNPEVHQHATTGYRTDLVEIHLAPDEELEYKAVLNQHQVLLYRWSTDHGEVYFDFHADAADTAPDFWVRYEEGEASGANGSLTAPFTGNHGWFWQNFNDHPITIRLEVVGYYEALHELGRFNPTQPQ